MVINHKTNEIEQYLFRRGGKYTIIAGAISLIHGLYLFFYFSIGLLPMTIYNIFCISGYIYFAAEAYKGSRIKGFSYYILFEIPIHSILSTIYIGYEYNFMLLLITAISIVFYFVLFMDGFKHPIVFSAIVAILYYLLLMGSKYYLTYHTPIYTGYKNANKYLSFFAYFNLTVAIVGITFFNILLTIEYTYVKNKLVSENSKLDNYATYDPLTNLLNRRSADEKLNQLFDTHYHDEDAFSVIMCDIDKFKLVNDTYGHDAGDYVLKEVAWILKDTVRDEDIVSRWGGEEFLIIVNNNKANAAILAERIRAQVESHTYKYNNLELHVTITLGVSSFHANSDINALIKSADNKLYRGKENGRNQVVA